MALVSGTRIGPYEVVAQIGVGGMGEVYRAADTKLKRHVAVKVLPASVAQDAERLARFQREAEVLAQLNHPNIAQIYGVEDTPGATALVMELVEGPTLADRIAPGPMSIDEALPIARQIAEALEAAHEQGVIHRDLKPANVKVREDGTVKVLDFGLAKTLEAAGGSSAASQSPTITTPAMTQAGVILGTAAYMSPEQAKGRPADKRSDIWAFGCVLYEMLSGRRAFEGEDVADTLAGVLRADPDWKALPPGVATALRTLLRSCLEKDRRRRLADLSAVRFVLDHAADLVEPVARGGAAPEPATMPRPPAWRRAAPIVAAVVAGLVSGAALVWWRMQPAPPTVVRTMIVGPESTALTAGGAPSDIAITPDGSRLVYRGDNRLLVRALDQLEPTVLSGLGAPRGVFIAPDGQWIGFFDAATQLKKVSITGGPALSLCAVPSGLPRGATWGEDGTVIFATDQTTTGLYRVPAAGGDPTVLTTPDHARGELDHIWPEFLPGSKAVLFTITPAEGGIDNAQIAVLDLRTNTQTVLVRGGSHAHYVSTGYLVYGTGGTLRAVRFDLARRQVIGTPVPVLERVWMSANGGVNAVVAPNGAMFYVAGVSNEARTLSTLVWVDRTGAAKPLLPRLAGYAAPRISPDGSRVAVSIEGQDGNQDIWVIDVERGTQTRLTSERGVDTHPLWTPDGRRITFASARAAGASALYWMAADGSGPAEALTKATTNQGATSWSPDGSTLAFYDVGETRDIFTLKPGAAPVRFLETPFQERGPAFSPDGRWIAYSSDETGREEIYVAPSPGPGGKIAISLTGGRSPRWSADGRELFYRNGRQMMVVAVKPGPTLGIGPPRGLFEHDYQLEMPNMGAHNYDVSGDGRRFIMLAPAAQEARPVVRPQMVLIQHWDQELKRLVPGD